MARHSLKTTGKLHDDAGPATGMSRRWFAGTAAALLFLFLLGGGAWYTMPLWYAERHPSLDDLEASLATRDLVVLGHLDARRAINIERRFMGAGDAGDLPGGGTDFIDALLDAGVIPRDSVDLVVAGGYAADQQLWASGVVLGRFDPAAVRRFIESWYEPAAVDGYGEVIHFTSVNRQTCERSPTLAASITPNRIVVTRADRLEHLLQRIEARAEAAVSLEAWRDFRGSRIASLGVFNAPGLVQEFSGMARGMLEQSDLLPDALTAAYLGFDAAAVPPGVTLTGAISSPDSQFLDEREDTLDDSLAGFRESLVNQPEISALFDHLRVYRQGEQLGTRLRLDADFSRDLGNLVQVGLESVFSGSGMQLVPGNTQPGEERVDESPTEFHPRFDPAGLPAFTDFDDPDFRASWTGGPVGIRVNELGVTQDGDDRFHLTLNAHARELVNVGDNGDWGRLRITEVVTSDGRSVMPEADCGRERNQDPAGFTAWGEGVYRSDGEFVRYRRHHANKRIVLAPGVEPEEVASINGLVELEVAVETARRVVEAPLEGKIVEMAGARVSFAESDDQEFTYSISGDIERVLAVRGLNAEGQALQSRGSSSMSPMFSASRYNSRRTHGTPAAVEVILATRMETLQYEFTLDRAYPLQSGGGFIRPRPEATTGARAREALQLSVPEEAGTYYSEPMATTNTGPVRIALTGLQTGGWWGFRADFDLRSALIPGLDHNLAAGHLDLESVVDANGEERPLSIESHFALAREGLFVNGEYQTSDDSPYLQGRSTLISDEFDGETPRALRGQVRLSVPLAMQRETIESMALGDEYTVGEVTIAPVSIQPGSLRLRVDSGRERLSGIEVLDAQGQVIHRQVRFDRTSNGEDNLNVSIGGQPRSLVLHVVTDAESRGYPFTLELDP